MDPEQVTKYWSDMEMTAKPLVEQALKERATK